VNKPNGVSLATHCAPTWPDGQRRCNPARAPARKLALAILSGVSNEVDTGAGGVWRGHEQQWTLWHACGWIDAERPCVRGEGQCVARAKATEISYARLLPQALQLAEVAPHMLALRYAVNILAQIVMSPSKFGPRMRQTFC